MASKKRGKPNLPACAHVANQKIIAPAEPATVAYDVNCLGHDSAAGEIAAAYGHFQYAIKDSVAL